MKKMILLFTFLSTTTALSAGYSPMFIMNRTITPGANSCFLQLAGYDMNYAIEWQVSDIGPNWTETHPFDGRKVINEEYTNCSNRIDCYVHGQRGSNFPSEGAASMFINAKGQKEYFQPNKAYYFAARQFIDSNKNGNQDPGEFVREWSTPTHTIGGDSNDRCTFNTFPAQ